MMRLFDFISNTFNNRELALGFWLLIFIIWMFTQRKIRNSIISLIKLLFSKTIFRMNLIMLIYISFLIYIFYIIDLWDVTLLKDTIYWTLGVAFIMLFNANKINENEKYFKNIIKDNVKFVIILEFIVNLYCFNLIYEIIFLPIMFLFIAIQTYSELKEELIKIQKIVTSILSIVGLIYLIVALFYIFKDLNNFTSYTNLRSLLFAPILTICYLPYIYFIALFMQYETLFTRLRIRLTENKKLYRYAKFRIFKVSLFNLKKLNHFAKTVPIYKLDSKEDIRIAIQDYIDTLKKCGKSKIINEIR